MFVDHIKIFAKAGDGGHGSASFRRVKFNPKGGPDGGDGGRGASIIFRADPHVGNLTPFFYEPIIKAKGGEKGKGKQCYGKAAPDKIVPVPIGTVVYRLPSPEAPPPTEEGPESRSTFINFAKLPADPEEDEPRESAVGTRAPDVDLSELEIVADLKEVGQEFVLCKGGKGGLGNLHFKNSRNQAPTEFTEGEPGEEGWFYLELRTIADAGLVGYPNAGKSTLLGKVSAAHPKVAPYPFTTLTPHIGVVEMPGYQRYTVADIPGLVEGAHENIGLGHDFLRHVTRCKLLVFILDMAGSEGREPLDDLQTLRREIDLHDARLSARSWIIVANKMDLPGAAENLRTFKSRYRKIPIVPISAKDGEGIEQLKETLAELITPSASQPPAVEPN
jgi:GTP-binding protein